MAPNDASIPIRRASLALARGDHEEAAAILERIARPELNPEVTLLRAQTLYAADLFQEALATLDSLTEAIDNSKLSEDIWDLRFHILLAAGDLERAHEHSTARRRAHPNGVLELTHAARIARLRADPDGASSLASEALSYAEPSTPYRAKRELADELYSLERYSDAAVLYEQLVKEPQDTIVWRRLCETLYQAGEQALALSYCEALREKVGPIRFFSELEISIHEDLGDLETAATLCSNYLVHHPDDLRIELRLAAVHVRRSALDDAKRLLDRPDDAYLDLGSASRVTAP